MGGCRVHPAGACLDLKVGLVGYWKLDEGRGAVASDSSGNGLSGTVMNGPVWSTDVNGMARFANPFSLKVDGINDHVRVTRTAAIEPAAVTVSIWIKRNGDQIIHAVPFTKTWKNNITPTWVSYAITLNFSGTDSSVVNFTTGSDGTADGMSSTAGALPDQTWVHVAGVYDPAAPAPQKKLYINGMLNASKVNTRSLVYDTTATGDLYLGQNSRGAYFNGWVDDVRIYNRALSASEVAALAAGQ